jgi:hypothetical protein
LEDGKDYRHSPKWGLLALYLLKKLDDDEQGNNWKKVGNDSSICQ